MIRSIRALALAAGLLAVTTPLAAQSRTGSTITFEAIDGFRGTGVREDRGYIYVTGLVQGEAAPRTVRVYAEGYESCERLLILSLERPGRYLVTLQFLDNSGSGACGIARRQ